MFLLFAAIHDCTLTERVCCQVRLTYQPRRLRAMRRDLLKRCKSQKQERASFWSCLESTGISENMLFEPIFSPRNRNLNKSFGCGHAEVKPVQGHERHTPLQTFLAICLVLHRMHNDSTFFHSVALALSLSPFSVLNEYGQHIQALSTDRLLCLLACLPVCRLLAPCSRPSLAGSLAPILPPFQAPSFVPPSPPPLTFAATGQAAGCGRALRHGRMGTRRRAGLPVLSWLSTYTKACMCVEL